jgi:hypothetical protein
MIKYTINVSTEGNICIGLTVDLPQASMPSSYMCSTVIPCAMYHAKWARALHNSTQVAHCTIWLFRLAGLPALIYTESIQFILTITQP